MDTMKAMSTDVAEQREGRSLTALVAGFSFASVIEWMDVVRAIVSQVVASNRQTPAALSMTALITTLLSILVFMVVSRLSKKVQAPQDPVYAVAR